MSQLMNYPEIICPEIQKTAEKNVYFKISKVEKKVFKCPHPNCPKQFREKGNLRTHIRVHTGERPFVCKYEDCRKSFITLGNLKSHLSNHTGEKPFICSYNGCRKQYSRLCRLKIHERTHGGDKPFKCPYKNCNKSFNEKGNLKTHFRIHTGEKPYNCKFEGCSQSFKALGHLKDHLKRHYNIRPYECEICSACFARTSTLKIHLHTHTGLKPHMCPFFGCGKSFSEKGNMKTHYRTHFINGEAKTSYNSVENLVELETTKMNSNESFRLKKTFKEKKLRKLSKNSLNDNSFIPLKQNNVFIKISNENLANLFELSPEKCEMNKPILLKSLVNHLIFNNANLTMKNKVNDNNNLMNNILNKDSTMPNENVFSLLYNKINMNTKNLLERNDLLNKNSNIIPNETFSSLLLNNHFLDDDNQYPSNSGMHVGRTNNPNEECLNKDSNTVFNVDKYFNLNEDCNKFDYYNDKHNPNDRNSFSTNILVSDFNNEESSQKNENISVNDFFITSRLQ